MSLQLPSPVSSHQSVGIRTEQPIEFSLTNGHDTCLLSLNPKFSAFVSSNRCHLRCEFCFRCRSTECRDVLRGQGVLPVRAAEYRAGRGVKLHLVIIIIVVVIREESKDFSLYVAGSRTGKAKAPALTARKLITKRCNIFVCSNPFERELPSLAFSEILFCDAFTRP